MQGVANFALRRHGAGNSILTRKFRLCKSAEKNCSEAGLYYFCLAYLQKSQTENDKDGVLSYRHQNGVKGLQNFL